MTQKRQKLCFVIMPFSDDRKEVYTYGIKPACERAGFKPVRVDELKGVFNINRKIIEHIYESDAVIADLTDKNPNVFYEMGVSHAIANTTIMIAQDTKDLPFDIRNYRCIFYKQSVEGLKKLEEDIVEFLKTLEDWRKVASNPAQDFKPHDVFIPKSEFEQLQNELRQKEALLKQSAPRAELAALPKQLREQKKKLLSGSISQTQVKALQTEREKLRIDNESLQKEIQKLRSQLDDYKPPAKPALQRPEMELRSTLLDELSESAVKKMLKDKGFFSNDWNKAGKGLQHDYEAFEKNGDRLVIDHATGLTWQQSGSPESLKFDAAQAYIKKMNDGKYAGFKDWRLPTLEEAMSLTESEQKSGDLYIDPIFDQKQRYIWTSDKQSASIAWVVNFYFGGCNLDYFYFGVYVRAVR